MMENTREERPRTREPYQSELPLQRVRDAQEIGNEEAHSSRRAK